MLLPGTGSVTPAGGVTVAVLVRVVAGGGGASPVTTNSTLAPNGSDTIALIGTAPLAGHVPPPVPVQVQVKPGSAWVSVTVAPVTPLGPRFETVMR